MRTGSSDGLAEPPGVTELTPREREVLGLLALGRSRRAIAEALGITARTAGTHVEHLYTKLGVGTREAAVEVGLRHGLVDEVVLGD